MNARLLCILLTCLQLTHLRATGLTENQFPKLAPYGLAEVHLAQTREAQRRALQKMHKAIRQAYDNSQKREADVSRLNQELQEFTSLERALVPKN